MDKKELTDKNTTVEKIQTFFSRAKANWWILFLALIIPALFTLVVATKYRLGLNFDHSITCRLFIVEKGVMPARGECIAFRCKKLRRKDHRPFLHENIMFIQRLAGIPGDRINVSTDPDARQASPFRAGKDSATARRLNAAAATREVGRRPQRDAPHLLADARLVLLTDQAAGDAPRLFTSADTTTLGG